VRLTLQLLDRARLAVDRFLELLDQLVLLAEPRLERAGSVAVGAQALDQRLPRLELGLQRLDLGRAARRVRIGGLLELPDALQQLASLGFEPLPVAPELVELRGLALELALRLLGFVRVATQRLDQVLPTLELGRQPLELELAGIQLPPQLGCGLAF